MKLSLSTFVYFRYPLIEAIRRTAHFGYDGVELWGGRPHAYADDMAVNCAPSSLAAMKQQLYADAGLPIVETSDKAERLMHESMTRPDFIEGITAFFQKRAPNFPPLTARD